MMGLIWIDNCILKVRLSSSFIDDGKLEFVYATEMLKIGLTKCKELGIKDW